MRRFSFFLPLALLLWCNNSSHAQTAKPRFVHSATQAQRTLTAPSKRVAQALWENDTATFARFIHPTQGVRFSPYSFLDVKRSPAWSRREIVRLKNSTRRIDWGDYDAEEKQIRLTWNEFRRKFLSPRDFSRGAQMTFQSTRPRGNTLNNLHSVYPDADLVEFHVPGSRKYGGMDWKSLWLVWRTVGREHYLVAIVGDQWTT